jgi:hypothetical protein
MYIRGSNVLAMPDAFSKVTSVKYGMLHVVRSDTSGQEGTLIGVNKDLSVTKYMLHGVNKNLSVTIRHAVLLLQNWRYYLSLFFSCNYLKKSVF